MLAELLDSFSLNLHELNPHKLHKATAFSVLLLLGKLGWDSLILFITSSRVFA
jgi:hypothetical protein